MVVDDCSPWLAGGVCSCRVMPVVCWCLMIISWFRVLLVGDYWYLSVGDCVCWSFVVFLSVFGGRWWLVVISVSLLLTVHWTMVVVVDSCCWWFVVDSRSCCFLVCGCGFRW